MSLFFPIASFLVKNYDNWFTNIFYTLSAVWAGLMFYFFIASVFYGLFLFGASLISLNISVQLIGKILFALAILISAYGFYNAHVIKVTEREVVLPNLPESWEGRRAVFVSDIHLGQIHGNKFAEKTAKKILELNPDIIFDSGDLYDGVKGEAFSLIEPLTQLKPPLGYYAVSGNHESYGAFQEYKEAVKKAGIKMLDNEVVEVDGVYIAGADYETTQKTDNFRKILKDLFQNVQKEKPFILIKHVPLNLSEAESQGVDLQLSGHTHRAQVFPLTLISNYVYKGYDYGLKYFKSMQLLVTDGVGTWGPPMRIGTHSEIVVIIFK
ncbi:MAG: metallophosphoesterase [Candidatus Pacebacteria bacterium]|nr:metallophosphoesterase [Candidatus Paceibacterota bacterium]MCF7862578.1 metallophosphoesterase [Candidatus Paceibacterota bacterium]